MIGQQREYPGVEDIAAAIGMSGTLRLCGVWGGEKLYIPGSSEADHPLRRLLDGTPEQTETPMVFRALVRGWGNLTISVPKLDEIDEWRTVRMVSRMLSRGMRISDVADIINKSERRVYSYRRMAEELELLPLIASGPTSPKKSPKKTQGDPGIPQPTGVRRTDRKSVV